MEKYICDDLLGKCCVRIPEHLLRFNGTPYKDYSVLVCKFHLNKEPYNKNIVLIKDLDSVDIVFESKEEKTNA